MKLKWATKVPRLHALLGMAFDADHVHVVAVSRAKDRLAAGKSVDAALTLPLTNSDPASVGREIRALLDAADIRERNCVVSLPPQWIMTHAVRVPMKLSGPDLDGFLQIEAEKGFPYDPHELQIARAVSQSSAGDWVTLFGVRRTQLEHLNTVMTAAGLQPVSYTLGLPALADTIPPAGRGRITVVTAGGITTMALAAGGGLMAFRTSASREAAAVVRELRITLEQIPAELRGELHDVWLAGDGSFADAISAWTQTAGLVLLQPDAKAPASGRGGCPSGTR